MREMETVFEPAAPDERKAADEQFVASWRDELLARTWDALLQYENESNSETEKTGRDANRPKLPPLDDTDAFIPTILGLS